MAPGMKRWGCDGCMTTRSVSVYMLWLQSITDAGDLSARRRGNFATLHAKPYALCPAGNHTTHLRKTKPTNTLCIGTSAMMAVFEDVNKIQSTTCGAVESTSSTYLAFSQDACILPTLSRQEALSGAPCLAQHT